MLDNLRHVLPVTGDARVSPEGGEGDAELQVCAALRLLASAAACPFGLREPPCITGCLSVDERCSAPPSPPPSRCHVGPQRAMTKQRWRQTRPDDGELVGAGDADARSDDAGSIDDEA